MSKDFKVISWNVNGIRAVEKKDFVSWLLGSGADVVCIQETKANPKQLSAPLLHPSTESSMENDAPLFAAALDTEKNEYFSYFSSAEKAGYSGTAVYSKTEPDKVELLGDERFDSEGRVTIAWFGKIAVISAYFPNSQDKGARLDYKLAFCDAIYKKCTEIVNGGNHVILCGDYNIAHKPIDLANPKANEGNAGYLPEERAWMDFFTQNGFTDTFRHFCQEPKQYSWWSYRFHAREKNIGWRIDYQCVDNGFMDKVKSSRILPEVTGSDHCPVEIVVEI